MIPAAAAVNTNSKSILDEIDVHSAKFAVKPPSASSCMPSFKTTVLSCAALLLALVVSGSVLILILFARTIPALAKISEMHTLLTTAVANLCKLPDTTELCRNLI